MHKDSDTFQAASSPALRNGIDGLSERQKSVLMGRLKNTQEVSFDTLGNRQGLEFRGGFFGPSLAVAR